MALYSSSSQKIHSYDGFKIEVTNWTDYNPRHDVKKPSWFRLDNNFVTGPTFCDLSSSQKMLAIIIFSLVSQKNGGSIRLSYSYLKMHTELDDNAITNTIDIFVERETTSRPRADSTRARHVHGRNLHATNERDERTGRTGRDERDVRDEIKSSEGVKTPPADVEVLEPEIIFESGPKKPKNQKPLTGETWDAYAEAYLARYKTEPVRNATVNGQLANFVKRLGVTEAPDVAYFYLTHSEQTYVRSMHPIGLMLRDAEKLRTEWITGKHMTAGHARHMDNKLTNYNAFSEVLAEIREGEKNGIK